MMASRGAVVFGGAGFIGGHLLGRLRQAGIAPLYSVDLVMPKDRVPDVCYILHDIRDLGGLVLPHPIDLAFDLVGIAGAGAAPMAYEQAIGGATSLSAFARRCGIMRLVCLGSTAVYGHGGHSLSEQSPIAPQSAQGWASWLAEGIYRSWQQEAAGRRLVICRGGAIFGPGCGGPIGRMARMMARGAMIYDGRKDLLCPCYHVDDLIDALFYALAQEDPQVVFNACYPERHSLGDIAALLKADAFPAARELVLPWAVVVLLAIRRGGWQAAEGFAAQQNPHDVVPGWLNARGRAKPCGLQAGLRAWIKADPALFPPALCPPALCPAAQQSEPRSKALPLIRRVFRPIFRPNGR